MKRALSMLIVCAALASLAACEPKPQSPKAVAADVPQLKVG